MSQADERGTPSPDPSRGNRGLRAALAVFGIIAGIWFVAGLLKIRFEPGFQFTLILAAAVALLLLTSMFLKRAAKWVLHRVGASNKDDDLPEQAVGNSDHKDLGEQSGEQDVRS